MKTFIFDLELKRQGSSFAYARQAEVRFRPRPTVGAYFRQYYLYARGDGKADLWFKRHVIRYMTYLTAPVAISLGLRKQTAMADVADSRRAGIFGAPILRLCQMTEGWPVERRLRALLMLPYLRLARRYREMTGYPAGLRWRLQRRKWGQR